MFILEKIKQLQNEGQKLEHAIKQVLSEQEGILFTPLNIFHLLDIDLKMEKRQLKRTIRENQARVA